MTGTIDEIDIPKVKVGQEAVITADALPGRKLKGHVTLSRLSASCSPTTEIVAGLKEGEKIYLETSR